MPINGALKPPSPAWALAPRWTQQMSHGLHPLLGSGILLTAVAAVALNLFCNGSRGDSVGAIEATKAAEAR